MLAVVRLSGNLLWPHAMFTPHCKISCAPSMWARGGEDGGFELKPLLWVSLVAWEGGHSAPLPLAILSLLPATESCLCWCGLAHPCMSWPQKTFYFHICWICSLVRYVAKYTCGGGVTGDKTSTRSGTTVSQEGTPSFLQQCCCFVATVSGPHTSQPALASVVHSHVVPALRCPLCCFSTQPVLPGGETDHKTNLEWRGKGLFLSWSAS